MGTRCTKCGGTTVIKSEMWNRSTARLVRQVHCESCGNEFARELPWGAVSPSQMPRDRGGILKCGLWFVGFLIVTWIALKLTGYGARSLAYRALTLADHGFLHPGWIVVLVLAATLLWLAGRRRAVIPGRPAVLAPDVHIRAEPRGKLSLILTGNRGTIAHDYVVDRHYEEEKAVLGELDDMARRSVRFEGGDVLPGADEIAETHRSIRALGRRLASILGGEGAGAAMDQLVDLPGDHLLLRVQRELSAFPWELLVPNSGGQPLWQLYCLSRQIRTDDSRDTVGRRPATPLRMLVVANLEQGKGGRGLPEAEREAQEILELGALKPELVRVVRRSPRDRGELMAALNEGYDIVHYGGHTAHGECGGAGWVLPSGEIVDGRDLFPPAAAPLLVFSNACGVGARGAELQGSGLAVSFAEGGVPAYLGTLWELHDAGSAAFALAFYRSLLDGETLGASVRSAREQSFRFHAFTWANYVLYGDPTARFIE